MRTEVLRLYRACMRSARKCPEWEKREMMKTYVRMKFRDEVHTRDTTRIGRMLANAREELDQMEYYHSVYAEKQRQRVGGAEAATSPSTISSPASELPAASSGFNDHKCPDCGSEYVPPHANFCSTCGLKRT